MFSFQKPSLRLSIKPFLLSFGIKVLVGNGSLFNNYQKSLGGLPSQIFSYITVLPTSTASFTGHTATLVLLQAEQKQQEMFKAFSNLTVYNINMKNSQNLNMVFTEILLSPTPFLTYISVLFVWVVALETKKNESKKVKREREVETHTQIRQRDSGV